MTRWWGDRDHSWVAKGVSAFKLRVRLTVRSEAFQLPQRGDIGPDAYETCVSVRFTPSAHTFRTLAGGCPVTLRPAEMAAFTTYRQHRAPEPAVAAWPVPDAQGSEASNRIPGYDRTWTVGHPSGEGIDAPRHRHDAEKRPTIGVCDGFVESRGGSTRTATGTAASRQIGSTVTSVIGNRCTATSSGMTA